MRTLGTMVVLLGVLVGVGLGQAPPSPHASGQNPTASMPAANDQDYLIGVEDMLSVTVWREPEVSGSMPVRPDGKISLPLLNDIQAAGLTPMQLAGQITAALKKFFEDPLVSVTVTALNSRRIFFIGQIGHTGAMPLLKDMTIMEALASAGCCLEFANTKKIYVLRNEAGKSVRHFFNYKEALKGRSDAQNFVLKPGDTIVVP
jgi:polysaccharide export outer membrane protein